MQVAMKETKNTHVLLSGIGSRVRSLRQARELTARELAARADLSQRFINQIEAGDANVSIAKLDQIAQALGCAVTDLIAPAEPDRSLRARAWRLLGQCGDKDWQALHEWLEQRNGTKLDRQFIALIGLRGAGKSTVGPLLAKRLKTAFIELDHWVEEAAGLSLAQIFTTHGESYYQELERKALAKLFATSTGCVFAVGGSIVDDATSWGQIKQRCHTVWLHATPQEYLNRMAKAGETRLTQRPTVRSDLKALLARREPRYAESNLTIKTTGKAPAKVVADILAALDESRKH
jgi:XRE family aerobic/anaerobic benzoate catabolism transcriptional regulator